MRPNTNTTWTSPCPPCPPANHPYVRRRPNSRSILLSTTSLVQSLASQNPLPSAQPIEYSSFQDALLPFETIDHALESIQTPFALTTVFNFQFRDETTVPRNIFPFSIFFDTDDLTCHVYTCTHRYINIPLERGSRGGPSDRLNGSSQSAGGIRFDCS